MDDQTDDTDRGTGPGHAAEPVRGEAGPPETISATAPEVLRGIAFACYAAAAVVAVLMLVVWSSSGSDGEPDFPGRYLFALLPLLAAAWAMGFRAAELDRPPGHRNR